MKIYNSGGTQLLDVAVEDSSVRYRAIMGDHNLTLKFSLSVHVELPVGAYVIFEGVHYTLKRPENLKMIHTRAFEYTVLFESPQADLKIWKFRNTVDGRLKFPMTARPHEHLTMLVANLNRRGSGWTVGDCIDGTEHLITYDHDYCWDALGKIAEEFKTEFEIDGKRISLKKIEYNKDAPLALSYGKGNGFRSGVTRQAEGNLPVEFLFVQGGDRNIDRSKYGSSVLLLPKNQTYEYEGRTYKVDDKGLSISRLDKSPSTYAEDSLDLSDIYPNRVGIISEVITVDAAKHFYDFTDTSLATENINLSEYQIEGEKMTVVFQTGMLAGHGEFEVNYFHAAKGNPGEAGYKKGTRFEIVPKEEDGYTMPDASFKPVAGDKYIVLNISLPDAYICNNESQTGASWEMFKEACRYMYEHEDNEFGFSGELDPLWAKQDWVNIGGKIKLGGYVSFTDARFQPTAVLVRITGIKDYVNKPHKPEIELSNKPISASFSTELSTLEGHEVQTEELHREALGFTKRRFRDAKETMDMLSDLIDAGFDNFTNNINPIAIQTMQLLVGDESLQYRFVNNKTTPATVAHNTTYNAATKKLSAPQGIVQHLTLGIDTLSSSHAVSEYKFWDIAAYESAVLTDPTKKYYFYVRVSRTGTTGTFLLSETAYKMDYGSTYYYLLYGILNSEYDGDRSFVPLYGYTEVLPGRVTTDKVISGDGNSYFDMLNNALRLAASGQAFGLDFNSQGDGKLRLRGTLVQSESGDEQPLGVFRGWWNETYLYYYGDEVLYLTSGQIVTYRYISAIPSVGNAPTDTDYWLPVAKGVRGDYPSTCFIRLPSAITPSTAPTGGTYESPIPTTTYTNDGTTYSWSDGIPSGEYQLWATTRTFKGDGSASSWSVPRKMTDTSTYDVEFAKKQTNDATPAAPDDTNRHGGSGTQIWFDPVDDSSEDFTQMYWRAEREKVNGEWGDWTIVRIKGEKGDGGQSSYKSTMFVRMNSTPTKPANNKGSYADPSPSQCLAGQNSAGTNVYWSDGIPSGENKLWATCRIFSSDGQSPQQSSWSTPRPMTDTSTYDVEFAKKQTNDATPAAPDDTNRHGGSGTQIWFDPVDDSSEDFTQMYWRAEREKVNGVWTSWVIIRIKGEKGSTGNKGDFFERRYAVNGSRTSYPTINRMSRDPSVQDSPWTTAYPSVGALQYLWMTEAKINGQTDAVMTEWSVPVRQTPYDGVDGIDGIDGQDGQDGKSPAAPFRGTYSSSKTYYGTQYRVDCVKYNGHYYVARIDAGEFSNKLPTNTDYWNDFGGEFESIATGFLLAELANIAGWIFKNNTLISQKGMLNGEESEEVDQTGFVPNIILDAIRGEIKAGENVIIDNDGLKLFDDNGKVVAQILNQSIANVVDFTKQSDSISGTMTESKSIYIPYSGSTFKTSIPSNYQVIGYMPKGSTLTVGNATFYWTLPSPSGGSGSYSYYSPILFEIRLMRGGMEVKKWSNSISAGSQGASISGTVTVGETITIDGETYKEGYYQLVYAIVVTVSRPGTAYSTGSSHNMSVNRSYSYNKSSFNKTLVGSDGLFSCWGSQNYMMIDQNGFIARKGNYVLRVSGSGIQKSTDGGSTWTSL